MRTRKVFKTDKASNLILQDANAEEIVFPDLEADDYPVKGDRIEIDGKGRETGERLMPDGTLIKFKDGVITEMVQAPEDVEDVIHTTAAKAVTKSFTAWKDNKKQEIEILTSNPSAVFRKGNRITVNGTEMRMGKVQINDKEVTIQNGRISSVAALNAKTPGTRKVFKPSGKKMIGIPKEKATSDNEKATSEKKKESLPGQRITYMRKKEV